MAPTLESIRKTRISLAVVLCGLLLSLLISVSCREDSAFSQPVSMTEQQELTVVSRAEMPAPESAFPLPPQFEVEDLVYYSDLIARVRLVEVEVKYRQGGEVHSSEMEFEFEVLEYLKGGSGGSRIWGIVELPGAIGTDLKEVRARATSYLNLRETRWDNVDAIIFMWNSHPDVPSTQGLDRYYLGWFVNDGVGSFSIEAGRGWLPLASSDGASGTSGEQQFLLDHPDGHSLFHSNIPDHPNHKPGVSGASGGVDKVGLSELKTLVSEGDAAIKQQIDATATANWWWMTEPRNLKISATHNSATVTWHEARIPSEVSDYQVLRRKQSDSDFIHLADVESTVTEDWEPTPTNITYEDTKSVEPSTTYVYRVLSRSPKYDGGTADGGSAEVTITTLDLDVTPTVSTTATPTPSPEPAATPVSTPNAPTTPPPAPQKLTVTATHNSVTLSWDAPDDDTVTGYRILRRRSAEENELLVHVENTNGTETTYVDEDNVQPSTKYIYRVRALNAAGARAMSLNAQITTARQP